MAVSTPGIVRGRPNTANQVPTLHASAAAVSGISLNNRYGGHDGLQRCVEITFEAAPITLPDAGGSSASWGSLELLDWPSAVGVSFGYLDITWTATGSGGDMQFSVGSAATGDATLSSLEVNIVAANTAHASAANTATASAAAFLPSDDVFLNFNTAADPVGARVVTVTGVLRIFYTALGD